MIGGKTPQLPATKLSVAAHFIGCLILVALAVLFGMHIISTGESVHWLDYILATLSGFFALWEIANTIAEYRRYKEESARPATPYATPV